MKPGAQTAIRGVLSVGTVNFLARLTGYAKHIIITAYIGLSADLDAFNMAATVLGLSVYVFGDIFDSLGVPRLVEADRQEGESAFLRLTSPILSLALLLSLLLTALLLFALPYADVIAPGFDEGKKRLLKTNLLLLLPIGLLYLPYHAMGSFLRARRRFQAFYIGEFLIAAVTFLILLFFHDRKFVIPVSFSVAYGVAIVYVAIASRKHFRFAIDVKSQYFSDTFKLFLQLVPIYMVGQLYGVVDRIFASYLDTGGVSALSYGFIIVSIPLSTLMLENIFVTPLSEAQDKSEMMGKIVSGILLISIPIALFVSYYSRDIVKLAFERGVFTHLSTETTSDALRLLALALPAFFLNPMLYRLLQITRKLKGVLKYAVLSVLLNAGLNALFLKMGMGVGGLALATTLANYSIVLLNLVVLSKRGIRFMGMDIVKVLVSSTVISSAAIFLTSTCTPVLSLPFGIVLAFLIYCAIILASYSVFPNTTMRTWLKTVLDDIFRRRAT